MGPKKAGARTRSLSQIKRIVIHHGATKRGLPGTNYLSYLAYHFTMWPIGGYTFGINTDGEILQGYDLTDLTYHVGNYNVSSLGIVLAGDFRYEDPTKEQWDSLYWLLDYLKEKFPNAEIVGHQEIPGYSWKPCPSLDMNQIRRNAASSKKNIVVVVPEVKGIQIEGEKSMLKIGSKGPDVKTWQEHLNTMGHNVGAADGVFGPKTEAGTKAFQRANNLTVDGIVGPQTLAKMEAILKAANKVAVPKKETATVTLGGHKITLTLE